MFQPNFKSKQKLPKEVDKNFKKEDFSLLFIARPSTGFPCHYMRGLRKYENHK
jgi:hypothetical protein